MRKVGVVTFLEDDWPKWSFLDPELPEYRDWLERFWSYVEKLEEAGTPYERVIWSPDKFADWCRGYGCKPDREGRRRYALQFAEQVEDLP